LLIPWIKQPLLVVAEPFGLRTAVLIAAVLLFAPPLTLLGMVGPYAIKLKTENLREVGRTAGDIYAISTVASVLSALLTGYFLIPNFGVSRLTLAIGILLLLSAALGLAPKRAAKVTALVFALIFLAGAGLVWMSGNGAGMKRGLVAVKESAYAEIRVFDAENLRNLLIDGGVHTSVNISTWKSTYPYVAVMDLTRIFFQKPGKLLLIGLGGGSVVKNFAREGWTVDAVEIDPVVSEIARKHFGLDPSESKIFHTDGRQFLITHEDSYDIVIMDAYGSSAIPFHLVTEEFFELVASRLKAGGVFAINVEALGWHDLLVNSLAATLRRHFAKVIALPTAEPPYVLGNVVLLAANRELEVPEEMLVGPADVAIDPYLRWHSSQINHAWDNRFVPKIDGVQTPVLTDDLNPIELWAERINLAARRHLHEYLRQRGLHW
jgi:spermidine synthase